MNIDTYKTFVVLAKTLSFSKSAEQLNVVQSTVSARIVELEKYLNKSLFLRSKRSVELTHAGRIFLPHAEKILKVEKSGLTKLKTMNLYEDQLKICVVGSLYRERLSAVIDEYYKKYPMYELDIEFRLTEVQLDMLLENETDIGFIYSKSISRKLEVRPYLDFKVMLVAPVDYPVDDCITTEKLASIDIALTRSYLPLQEWFEEIMPKHYRPRLRINSTVQLLEYVKKGYGCAFLQDFFVKKEIEAGRMRQIHIEGVEPFEMSSFVAINKSRLKSDAVQRFLELIPEFDEYQYNI